MTEYSTIPSTPSEKIMQTSTVSKMSVAFALLVAPAGAFASQTLVSDEFKMIFRVGNATVPGGYTLPTNVLDYPKHVDIGFPVVNEGGVLEFEPHWHKETDSVEYEPGEAHGSVTYTRNRPVGAMWDFIGIGAGNSFFNLRSSPPDLSNQHLYLGWATEESQDQLSSFDVWNPGDARANTPGQWTRLQLNSVTGPDGSAAPGVFSMWQTNDDLSLTVWMTSNDGVSAADALFVDGAVHTHKAVGFSAAGIYELNFQASTVLIPEPAALGAMMLGAGVLLRRVRREKSRG